MKAMCPEAEGAPESGAPYRIEIICAPLFVLAPLSGRICAWRVPRVETRLKPWADRREKQLPACGTRSCAIRRCTFGRALPAHGPGKFRLFCLLWMCQLGSRGSASRAWKPMLCYFASAFGAEDHRFAKTVMRIVTRILFSLRPAFRDIKGGAQGGPLAS